MDNFTNLLMDECPPELQSPDDDVKESREMLKNNKTSKGVAMSFGFKRRTNGSAIPTLTSNINTANKKFQSDTIDTNGNDDEIRNVPKNNVMSKLPPPKKEGLTQQKVSRFGFRQPRVNRTVKVNEINTNSSKNVIVQNNYFKSGNNIRPVTTIDNNRNRSTPNKSPVPNNQMGKFILQSTQLPKPQSVRVFETKTTKTIMNNNTKLDNNITFRRFHPTDFGRNFPKDDFNTSEEIQEFGGNSMEMDESFEAPLPKLPSVFHKKENSSAFESRKEVVDACLKTQNTFLRPATSTGKNFLKSRKLSDNNQSSSDDQDWDFGGEAMAEEPSLSLTCNTDTKNEKLFVKKLLPLKTDDIVTTSLDEETSPVESILSFTENDEMKKKNSSDTKDAISPSNSSSLSEGKDDFLIDDEIADQPGLVFDDKSQQNSETTLIESTPRSRRKKLRNFDGSPMFFKAKKSLGGSVLSLDTLSPCESIASDDLMMDYEFSQSSIDDGDRGKIKNDKNTQDLDETLTLTISSQSDTNTDNKNGKETWAALKMTEKISISTPKPRFFSGFTPTSSPKRGEKYNHPRTFTSPMRRLTNASLQETEDFLVLQKTTHAALKNDIVNVKAMLFKLRRVLNESETQNPLEQQNNGFNEIDVRDEKFELEDLKRQLLFLQGQLEDKEKTVQDLQKQLTKMCVDNYLTSPTENEEDKEVYNAATQTDRIRPSGYVGPPSLTSPGSLISLNDWTRKT